MQSFLESTVVDLLQRQQNIQDIVIVLPSKRAGNFLRSAIAKVVGKTIFSPKIYSVESFIENISGIAFANNTELLFGLYETYRSNGKGELDNFHAFSKWGQTLIQDFNEIDRHLIDPKVFFSNLSSIQEISIWSPEIKKTKMMEDYLKFWNNIENLYSHFNQYLKERGIGYQGLVYRSARNNLSSYIAINPTKHLFIGFNALNTAESEIIQELLSCSLAEIYWDIDAYFLNDPIHDAGYFIRKYKQNWPYLKESQLQGVSNHYSTPKNIQIIGVPKNISQAKYVGSILSDLSSENAASLKKTALVLGDETLLNPILNSIPEEINAVNITMGSPLRHTQLADLFDQFIDLYVYTDSSGWYYRSIEKFLAHPSVQIVLRSEDENAAQKISAIIKSRNLTHLDPRTLQSMVENDSSPVQLLFFEDQVSPLKIVEKCLGIINELKLKLQNTADSLSIEVLYRFHTLFNQIFDLLLKQDFITDLKSLQSLYRELLSSETMDYQGDPLEGLQIMGMLESRNLDFETVIITSVNEGILPSGKSNNSFIPFDLKIVFGLPTYKEKDAIYTYHFYRLLQRAKNVYLLYNTEPDVLEGGEKSRLISQLQTDESKIKDIKNIIAAPKINAIESKVERIEKDESLMNLINDLAGKGFSPSSLSNYIRNPIDFYKQNLLGIKEVLEVEETVAANTFGTIVHDTLEDLYLPVQGEYLTESYLKSLKPKIKGLVKHHFAKSYLDGNTARGKNLIAFHVIIRYVGRFIDLEIEEVKSSKIKILGLEENLAIPLNIPELNFAVILRGKIDRIDIKDGILRIVDYKTGKVEPKNVTISDWENIIAEYDYSKAFQLLCYCLMYNHKDPFENAEAGIITFKNLNAGIMRFSVKGVHGGNTKEHSITKETLGLFYDVLKKLILEICNPNIPFVEKKV